MGTNQARVEERFADALKSAFPAQQKSRVASKGFLVEGAFGTGKSHTLERLRHASLEQNVACSTVVVSKEMPLGNIDRLYRNAIRDLTLPKSNGRGLADVLQRLDRSSPGYVGFYNYAMSSQSEYHALIKATLYLYHHGARDRSLLQDIYAFWSGEPLRVGIIRHWLRDFGVNHYELPAIRAGDLATQRMRFATDLLIAAGCDGWVVLIDELELIAKLGVASRIRAYSAIGLLIAATEFSIPRLLVVGAMTNDLAGELIEIRHDDREVVYRTADDTAQAVALAGLNALRSRSGLVVSLEPPTPEFVAETYATVSRLYEAAYGFRCPPHPSREAGRPRSLRHHVRSWITEWDIRRLHPEAAVYLESRPVTPDLSEDDLDDDEC